MAVLLFSITALVLAVCTGVAVVSQRHRLTQVRIGPHFFKFDDPDDRFNP